MRKHVGIVLLLIFFIVLTPAYAANGTKVLGSGAISPIMGGTGCVEPQDTAAMMINPAGITKIGNRIDLASEFTFIDARMDTSAVPYAPFRNSHETHKSTADFIAIPHAGFAGRIKDSAWYYGCAAALTSGLEVDYKYSRLSQAVTNNEFDRHVQLYSYEVTPTIAYKPIEPLSVGLSGVVLLNRLTADITNSSLKETIGHDNGDYAWGVGLNAGAIYDFGKWASIGFSFKSMRWNEKFTAYNDTLYALNGPPEYIMGISVKPLKSMLIESDIKFIHWRWVDIMEKSPDHGGYGWQNQWVYGVGVQYAITDKLRIRGGYNYGKSPIEEKVVYANVLSGLISEHHLGIGVGYDMFKNTTINAGWVHIFRNAMTDDGTGDIKSVYGKGAKSQIDVNSFYCGVSYTF